MIIIIIFSFLLLLTKMLIKDKLSLIFLQLFLGWWGLLLFISTFNPYGLYPVSIEIYSILILSVSCFTFGFIINRYIRLRQKKNSFVLTQEQLLDNFKILSDSKLYFVLVLFFTLFIGRYLIQYQKMIILYGTEDARNMRFYVGEVFGSSVEIFFYNYFVESFSILVSVYVAFSLVWLKFDKVFWLSIIFLYVYSSFGAGRGAIIELAFYICFFYFVKSKIIGKNQPKVGLVSPINSGKKSKALLIIVPMLIFIYLFSIYLSNFRSGLFEISIENFVIGNEIFFSQIVIYCVGSFRALEYGITQLSPQIGFTYGSLSFGGIDEFLGVVLNAFKIKYEYSNAIYGLKTSSTFNIGYDVTFNALFTGIFVQYLDFGLFGVIFLSFFWGMLFNRVIVFFQRTQTIYSLFMVSFLFVTAIVTPLTWKLQSPSSIIFLISLFLLKRNKLLSKNG